MSRNMMNDKVAEDEQEDSVNEGEGVEVDPEKEVIEWMGPGGVDIELEHFTITGVPEEMGDVATSMTTPSAALKMVYALISEVIELRVRAQVLEEAVLSDRVRIRQLERSKPSLGGPGMGGMGGMGGGVGIGLIPTPAALATADAEPPAATDKADDEG
jgi:hypothetical protein